jgi:hypothetical protein
MNLTFGAINGLVGLRQVNEPVCQAIKATTDRKALKLQFLLRLMHRLTPAPTRSVICFTIFAMGKSAAQKGYAQTHSAAVTASLKPLSCSDCGPAKRLGLATSLQIASETKI